MTYVIRLISTEDTCDWYMSDYDSDDAGVSNAKQFNTRQQAIEFLQDAKFYPGEKTKDDYKIVKI